MKPHLNQLETDSYVDLHQIAHTHLDPWIILREITENVEKHNFLQR